MAILLPALIGLVPLLIAPGISFHYDIAPRIVLLAVLLAIALFRTGEVADGIAALRARKAGRWLLILAAAQVVWTGIATALSTRPWFSLLGANWRRMGLLTILSLVVFTVLATGFMSRKPWSVRTGLRVFAIAGIAASIYGIAQYFDVDPFQAPALYHAQAGDSTIVRPPGTLGHADYFGWWLAVALFCAIELERMEKGAWRWVARAAYAACGAAILFTGTRSAILAVGVGFVLLAMLAGFRPGRKHLLAALGCIAALTAFYISPAGARMRARVQWSVSEPLGGARPLLWMDTLRMAAAHPIAGWGPETFSAEFPRYQSTQLARLLPDFYYESPHNTALDALTDQGVPGLLLAMAWISLGCYAARGSRRANAPLISALIASSVASMFGAATLGPIFATAVVIAMLIALSPADRVAQVARPDRPLLTLVSVPIGLALAAWAVFLTASEVTLARFQNSRGPAEIAAWNSLARIHLPGSAEDLYCSRQLLAVCQALDVALRPECLSSAGEAARRAIETADSTANAWYNLAIFEAIQNDPPGVERGLRQSIRLAPHWFKPHWSLANLLALSGRTANALDEARKGVLLDAGKDPEVTQTLDKLEGRAR